ncbi:hypothetical protein [Alkalilimnicola sp. S0819]|uniref:hypothetical protein n=1 Tax=Alkalilimnicola sp. S0819 TaxID=2613922 RepID=UPI0012629C9E|nr:hypothetical protein [Alkalilimnicola sp. S0819]KAB7624147.1 hypothetical protein F3N43_07095 [Alkalilimnicola sp. S0819]MPQ16400.1 hypothetical protein [Alkalilimnicola sp. S0819]
MSPSEDTGRRSGLTRGILAYLTGDILFSVAMIGALLTGLYFWSIWPAPGVAVVGSAAAFAVQKVMRPKR